MGWSKNLSFSEGGALQMGNWYARYNSDEDSIDLEHNSDGIPYIKNDTTFIGTHGHTEVSGGVLQIEQWPGWDEAATVQDEAYILDDATTWDDITNNGDDLVDYLFGAIAVTQSYEGAAIFESAVIDLTSVGRYNSSAISWTVNSLPAGTSVTVEAAVYDGESWSSWTAEVSGTAVDGMPVSGTNLSTALYKSKYRVTMVTNSSGGTPTISDVTITINSRKHIRVMSTGDYKESQHIIDSVLAATEETL